MSLLDKETWYKKMYDMKREECKLFEQKWIDYRDFLLNIHFSLAEEDPRKKEIEKFTSPDINWRK